MARNNNRAALAEVHIPKRSWLELAHLLNGFIWVLVFQFVGITGFIVFWTRKEQNYSLMSLIALGIITIFNLAVFLNLILFLVGFPKILLEKLKGHSRDDVESNEDDYALTNGRYKYTAFQWSELIISTVMTLAVSIFVLSVLSSLAERFSQHENTVQIVFFYLRLLIFLWVANTLFVKLTLLWRGLHTLKKRS